MTLVLVGGLTAVFSLSFSTMAEAAEPPSPPPLLQRTDDVVTADPLPTVQIDNGYVWAQTTIGSTVYAVGDFDNARAPLAAPGTQLTPRSNILAYDINTGALLPFAPQVNGVIKAVAASPDGSRIYFGGSFTSVNGEARWNMAAVDAVSGQLLPEFKPAIGGSGVYALVAHGSMVYAAGLFTQGNGVARQNAAAFSASNGALMPWAPQTDRQIDAMVADPGGEKIILGGRFSEVNGDTSMRGVAAIDQFTGAVDEDWALPQTVKNGRGGTGGNAGKAGIFALAADDDAVYGTGWVFADVTTGNLEGTFAAEADSGEVRWIADCLGDHYGVYSTGKTVYTTSHTHACSTMGLHPEQSPRNYRYVEAYTTDARGLLGHNPHAGGTYQDWAGTPGPSAYVWYPDFYTGTTSGLGQAGLSITGVGDIISVAGEFVGVNNQRYEGIVRFSTNPPQGAQDGPRISGSNWQPTANSFIPGRARVSIPGNWDRDDLDLTYELRRAGTSTPVDTKTVPSTWWSQPGIVLEDTTAAPGSTPTYTVVVRDGDGNTATSQPVTTTVTSGTVSDYVTAVIDDAPQLYYPLGDTMQDWAGANPPVADSGVSPGAPGIENSSTGYSTFNGSSSGRVTTSSRVAAPAEFSTELWFRTSSSRGGKMIGYGDSSSGNSSSYDRHVYMSNSGQLVFGVYPGSTQTIQSGAGFNDGEWHHVVASQSADGMKLYVDGALVAANAAVTTAQSYSGYWRIGGDNLNGWPSTPSSYYFDGAIDEVAVYDRALDPSEVTTHYGIGKGLEAPTASFTANTEDLEVTLDAHASSANGEATLEQYLWDFGDGSPETSGETATHSYASTGTYTVTLTVVDSNGLSATSTQTVNVTGPNIAPSAQLETSVAGLTVTADGSGSTDPDGEILAYDWDWGDGESSSGMVASHQYAAAGFYTVTLTVTDDRGGTAETTGLVTATHADPTAQFTASTSGLTVDVDAGASSAADGASLTYSWDWGDGTTSSQGTSASHSYAADGDYEITLTVTDSLGSTAESTQPVTVTSEVFVASDSFERSVGSGWGSADVGGVWTSTGWNSAAVSVGDGVGTMVLAPAAGRDMVLAELSLSDSASSMTYTLDGGPSTGSLYFGMKSRYDADGHAYRSLVWHRADGSVWLVIQRDDVVLAVLPTSMQWDVGESFELRTEVVGEASPVVRMKVWPVGSVEPAGWQLEATDASAEALTVAGSPSVYLYRSGASSGQIPVHIDDYRVQDLADPGEPVSNVDPVAAFTSSVSEFDVSVDGSSSSDEDGSIASYAWDFGDGTTDTGVTASHTYGEEGIYDVSLTVTDDEGATHTVTQPVTIDPGEPVSNVDPVAAFTSSVSEFDVSVDGSSSSDEDGSIASYAWDFGDGTTDTGVTASHTYGEEGIYDVSLTVTDDEGATHTVTQPVTVSLGAGEVFVASDSFERSVGSGWGSADVGGVWTSTGWNSAAVSVGDGVGTMVLAPAAGRDMVLAELSLSDSASSMTYTLDGGPSTGSLYFGMKSRYDADGHAYRSLVWHRADGSVWLVIQRDDVVLAVLPTSMQWDVGESFELRTEVVGEASPVVRMKVWPVGSVEPAGWQLEATDASAEALTGAGSPSVYLYRSGASSGQIPVHIDDYRVTDTAGLAAAPRQAAMGDPEGTEAMPAPDGTEAMPAPDGTEAMAAPDGTEAMPAPDGTEEAHPDKGEEDADKRQDSPASKEAPLSEDEPAQEDGTEPRIAADPDTDSEEANSGTGSEEANSGTGSEEADLGAELEPDAGTGEEAEAAPEEDEPDRAPAHEDHDATDEIPADDQQAKGEEPPSENSEPVTSTSVEENFDRRVETGWGHARHGGSWTPTPDSEATLSVAEGTGRIDLAPGAAGGSSLEVPVTGDSTIELDFRVEDVGGTGTTTVGVIAGQGDESAYVVEASMSPDGTVRLAVRHGDDLVAEQLLEDAVYEPGSSYTVVVSVEGDVDSVLAAKLWEHGSDEPADWQLVATADDLPTPREDGPVGVTAALSDDAVVAVTVHLEELTVRSQD